MRWSVLALVLARAAFAQESGRQGEEGKLRLDESAPAPEGYKGVQPGGTALPPNPPKLPIQSGPQRLTWTGFQVKEGVPTVFMEVTAPPDYTIVAHKGQLVVTLRNTKVPLKNNRRPLRVGALQTHVADVVAREKGRDTQVLIKIKEGGPLAHKAHLEPAAGGFQMLVIELPPSR
jgi:hypothetical protein